MDIYTSVKKNRNSKKKRRQLIRDKFTDCRDPRARGTFIGHKWRRRTTEFFIIFSLSLSLSPPGSSNNNRDLKGKWTRHGTIRSFTLAWRERDQVNGVPWTTNWPRKRKNLPLIIYGTLVWNIAYLHTWKLLCATSLRCTSSSRILQKFPFRCLVKILYYYR